MSSVFQTILCLSISGSLLTLFLFALKPLIQNRLSKAFSYYIWVLVLLRLLLPIESPINGTLWSDLLPSGSGDSSYRADILQEFAGIPSDHVLNAQIDMHDNFIVAEPEIDSRSEVADVSGIPAGQFLLRSLPAIWIAGVIISILWFVIPYSRFRRILIRSFLPPDAEDLAVFRTVCGTHIQLKYHPDVNTPMLVGCIRPCIVLPEYAYVRNGLQREFEDILRHEFIHYRRKDILYKWAVVLVTSLHWFNPLMYAMRREISRTCELSCDEAVIANMSAEEKRHYGKTLLVLASNEGVTSRIPTMGLAVGKERLKERLLGIMKYRKKGVGTMLVSTLLTICLTGCGAVLGIEKQPASPNQGETVSLVGSEDTPVKVEILTAEPVQDAEVYAMTPSLDLDGDGMEDRIRVENFSSERSGLPVEEWKVVLSAELGSGGTAVVEIPGWWWITGSHTADFDVDGKIDIALILGVGGSNFNATQVYVYRVENGKFVEFDKNVIPNDTLDVGESQFESSGNIKLNGLNGEIRWVGGTVVSVANMPMLRLRQLVDYSPGENIATAYYMNLSWNGNGWSIQSMDLGEAYGEEVLFEQ